MRFWQRSERFLLGPPQKEGKWEGSDVPRAARWAEIQAALKETPPGFPRASSGKAAPSTALWGILSPSHAYGENYRSERTGIPVPPSQGVPAELAGALYRCEFSSLKERNRADDCQALLRMVGVQGGHGLGLTFSDTFWTAVFTAHPRRPNKSVILATQRRLGSDLGIPFPTSLGKFCQSCRINKQRGEWED